MARLSLAALIGLAALAPASAQSYLPLADGQRWVYTSLEEVSVGGGVKTKKESTAQLVVVEATEVDGRTAYILGWKNHGERQVVSVEGDVIVVHRGNKERLLLPADFANPAASEKRVRIGDLEVQEHQVGKAETVETPAGTYEAVPVSAVVKAAMTEVRSTVWYARGVGPVKLVEAVKAPATSVTRTLLLQSCSFASGEDPAGEGAVELEAPTPATPSGAISITDLVTRGASADLSGVQQRVAAVIKAASGLHESGSNGTIPGGAITAQESLNVVDRVEHKRLVCGSGTIAGELRHCLVICDGDFTIAGEVRHCVLIVGGKLTVAGELRHSLVISKGDVSVPGEMRHGTTVSHGQISVMGKAKYMVLEAAKVRALGEIERSAFTNTEATAGKGNEARTCSPTLRECFPLK